MFISKKRLKDLEKRITTLELESKGGTIELPEKIITESFAKQLIQILQQEQHHSVF